MGGHTGSVSFATVGNHALDSRFYDEQKMNSDEKLPFLVMKTQSSHCFLNKIVKLSHFRPQCALLKLVQVPPFLLLRVLSPANAQ